MAAAHRAECGESGSFPSSWSYETSESLSFGPQETILDDFQGLRQKRKRRPKSGLSTARGPRYSDAQELSVPAGRGRCGRELTEHAQALSWRGGASEKETGSVSLSHHPTSPQIFLFITLLQKKDYWYCYIGTAKHFCSPKWNDLLTSDHRSQVYYRGEFSTRSCDFFFFPDHTPFEP